MIHEYFIDPKLFLKWASSSRDYKFILDKFGVGSPRLLSSFPQSKASSLRKLLLNSEAFKNLPDAAQTEVGGLIDALTEQVIRRRVSENISNDWYKDWSENAKKESSILAPSVIISGEEISDKKLWITGDEALEIHHLIDHPEQLTPERTPEAFTKAVNNLLRYSNKIIIADPYLGTESAWDTVEKLIKLALSEKINQANVEIQLIYGDVKKTRFPHYIIKKIESLKTELPFKFSVYLVEEKSEGEKFHNRYLLTELGGITFGAGTQLNSSKGYHTDDLLLLKEPIYTKRWNQYFKAAAFDILKQQHLILNIN
jgi:hypothetical protein